MANRFKTFVIAFKNCLKVEYIGNESNLKQERASYQTFITKSSDPNSLFEPLNIQYTTDLKELPIISISSDIEDLKKLIPLSNKRMSQSLI